MTHNARSIEVKIMKCKRCEEIINKCSECGKYFTNDQKINCVSDGLKHKCVGCI